ncbi:MAG TPA: hypothetical protein VFJ85_17800 [Acidimicrobiales bacterium]|nr:hypothetical protein [Acidimicrobiales bacterium]
MERPPTPRGLRRHPARRARLAAGLASVVAALSLTAGIAHGHDAPTTSAAATTTTTTSAADLTGSAKAAAPLAQATTSSRGS